MRHIPDQVVTSVTSMWIAAHATRKHILGGGPGSEHMERFEGNGAGRRQRERNGSPWVTFREWMGDKILRNCTTREVGSSQFLLALLQSTPGPIQPRPLRESVLALRRSSKEVSSMIARVSRRSEAGRQRQWRDVVGG
ncbi:hypothetical protein BV25DRAFT_1820834 [Artomyces pyxidatus]|uniref:Uncharacterized protein n=1 Tax=Artomyces pyxidatus TaxID=48021 RepID=A0ACB8TEB5_9AGAM|nr:hypothetical protein BV25DRAFT_1820834 [Artomyces pyxidatus]